MVRPRRQLSRAALGTLLLALRLIGAPAADAQRVHFDLPADSVERSIKRFAAQSGLEVLVPADDVRSNVKTRPVQGTMAPREALEAMLAGTGLTVVRDAKTGALALRRSRAEPPKSSEREPPPAGTTTHPTRGGSP